MIEIQCNSNLIIEKEYIIQIVFSEFLGLDYKIKINDDYVGFLITMNNHKSLHLGSSFWDDNSEDYLTKNALPDVTYTAGHQFSFEETLPILYGKNNLSIEAAKIHYDNDIFATCFFMISRMEEAINIEKDNHNRFPSTQSIAFQNGFLNRPIVDEYVQMLWNILRHLDPSLTVNKNHSKLNVTCDVDWPFDPLRRSLSKSLKQMLFSLIRKKDPLESLSLLLNFLCEKLNIPRADSYRENISWMMDVNEQYNNKVAFYFITEATSKFDSKFDVDSKKMRNLFQEIHSRGHEIGLHPGYECFNNPTNFKSAVNKLRRVLKEENINQPELGGRMHYLRWDIRTTPQLWEMNQLDYDSTLSFADQSGFRCGTSRIFSMFDLINRKPMKLKQKPLIAMECTIIAKKYENLGYTDKSYERFVFFKEQCKKHSTDFTLLWHNSHFDNPEDKMFYKKLIKEM